jgi:hypothetical protein
VRHALILERSEVNFEGKLRIEFLHPESRDRGVPRIKQEYATKSLTRKIWTENIPVSL